MKSCIVSIVRFRPFLLMVGLLGLVGLFGLVVRDLMLTCSTVNCHCGHSSREQAKRGTLEESTAPAPKCFWLSSWTDKSLNVLIDYMSHWICLFSISECVCFYYAIDSPYRPLYGAQWCYNMLLPCLKHFWKQVDTKQIKTDQSSLFLIVF